jgi:hypothetical protein
MQKIKKKNIIIFSFGVLSIYIFSVLVLAKAQQTSFNGVSLFNPEISMGSDIIRAVIVLSGWLLVYFIPGFLWLTAKKENFLKQGRLNIIGKSFLTSILLLAASTTVFKLISQQRLERTNFVATLFILIFSGSLILWRNKSEIWSKPDWLSLSRIEKNKLFSIAIGLAIILVFMFVFRGKIFLENFSEGGIEFFYPAESLKQHILPYADLELGGRFGLPISDPYLTISFINLFNILLFGASEAAVRLHFFLYLFLLYLLVNIFAGPFKKSNVLCLGCFMAFFVIVLFFYIDHNAYFEDIADYVTIPLFVSLFYLSIYFLLNKESAFFFIASTLATLTLWSGLALVPIALIGFRVYFSDRKDYLKSIISRYLLLMFILTALYLIYGSLNGYLQAWYHSLRIEYINELFYSSNNLGYILTFLFYFIFLAGVVPALAIFILKHKDREACLFSFVTLGYLLVVFKSSYINLHYFAPVIFLPLVSSLRLSVYMHGRKESIAKCMLFFTVSICLIISLPKKYIVHTAYRDIGKQICMLFDSFEGAYRHRDICQMDFNRSMYFKHYVDIETIPYYAKITTRPRGKYNYYISDNPSVFDHTLNLLGRNKDTYLFVRDLNHHILLNERYKDYPSRIETAAGIFKRALDINLRYDDEKKGYFFY